MKLINIFLGLKSTSKSIIETGKEKRGLFYNINKRKKAGKSRSKSNTTIDPDTYDDMKDW
jgi:hypothetical protein